MESRSKWHSIFQVLKELSTDTIVAKIFFRNEGKIMTYEGNLKGCAQKINRKIVLMFSPYISIN